MKKYRDKFFLSLILVILIFSSCETVNYTTLNFGKDTENLKILHRGAIGKDVAINNENILLDGDISHSTHILDILLPDEILLPGNIQVNRSNIAKRRWTGIVHFNNEEFVIRIDSDVSYSDENSVGRVENYGDVSSDINIDGLIVKNITVDKLPTEYNFKKFDVFSALPFNYIEEEDMPLKLTSFSVDNKTFSVLLTVKRGTTNPNVYSTDSPLILVLHPKQVFQFVDDSNTVYAELVASGYERVSNDGWLGKEEYRDGSYTIFDVDADFDETKLVPAIAVIDIVKYMTQYHSQPIFGGNEMQ